MCWKTFEEREECRRKTCLLLVIKFMYVKYNITEKVGKVERRENTKKHSLIFSSIIKQQFSIGFFFVFTRRIELYLI